MEGRYPHFGGDFSKEAKEKPHVVQGSKLIQDLYLPFSITGQLKGQEQLAMWSWSNYAIPSMEMRRLDGDVARGVCEKCSKSPTMSLLNE